MKPLPPEGSGIVVRRLPRAGKSSTVTQMVELAALCVPMIVFDLSGELLPIENSTCVAATFASCPMVYEVLARNLQVVYTASSWPSRDMFGLQIATLLNQLFIIKEESPRTACTILLDEALWLVPLCSSFSEETSTALELALALLSDSRSVGKKMGQLL